jgi:hypothetical protein
VQVLATKSTGSIGGSNTQVQFNNSGSLGGSSSFTWDGTTVTATKFAGALNGTVGATTASTGAFTTLSTSSTTTLSGLTASTALALDASKNVVSVTNTGTGNNVLSASPTLTGTIAGASLSLSSLTSGRVTYAGASGLLTDSANLLYSGTDLTVYGITVGRGGGAVATSTALGASAMAGTNTGVRNTGLGYFALNANTSGQYNTAIGAYSLVTNNTTSSNTGIGHQALYFNVGNNNTAVGDTALLNNAGGSSNTAVGASALTANTSASNNTAVGYGALNANTTIGGLTAVGNEALYKNLTGTNNAAFGFNVLHENTSGSFNAAFGGANFGSTQGTLGTNTSGSYNTAIGFLALYSNTTAVYNTAVGYQALYGNIGAQSNTAVGYQAGFTYNGSLGSNCFIGFQAGYSTTGDGNTFVGARNIGAGTGCGSAVTTGGKNVIIGGYSGSAAPISATGSNYIILSDGDGNVRGTFDSSGNYIVGGTSQIGKISGYFDGATVSGVGLQTSKATTGSNFIVFNNSAGATAGYINHNGTTTVNYVTSSDYRLKENITPISNALAKVAQLKPVTYTWKNTNNEQGEGFIAHELAEVCPLAVCGKKDDVNEDGSIKSQGIDSSKIIGLLTAAIQELKVEFDAYKATHP